MKVAALDLGTNSFLCLIVQGDQSGIKSVLSDQVRVVRLGEGVDKTGSFSPAALVRARECLSDFKSVIDKFKVDRILAMATSAARDATNGSELFAIGKELGIPIEIIPGADEARITFRGATEGELKGPGNVAVIDVGGGSTEIIVGNREKIIFSKSLNIGAVRLTEKLITSQPVSNEERAIVEKYINEQIAVAISEIGETPIDEVIAVAGTPTALAAASMGRFNAEKIQGFILDQEMLRKWCELLAATSVEEKIDRHHLEAGRADVIFIGATILYRFLAQIKKPLMKVSIKGVRYGVALEALSRG